MSSATPLNGLVVCLADVEIDELVGAVEVLVQEGFTNFSLPIGNADFEEFVGIYGARARLGAHALRNTDDVARLVALGGTFAFFDLPHADGVRAAAEAGLAVYAQAMTPAEVRDVLELPVTAAMLYPADIVGHAMALRLEAIGLGDKVVPRGAVGAYAAGEWAKSGAPAICVDNTLLGDALVGGDLSALRDRCASFIQVQKKHFAA